MAPRFPRSGSLALAAASVAAAFAILAAAKETPASKPPATKPSATTTPAKEAPPSTITRQDARKAVAAVFSQVETIRGLSFRKPVPVEVIDDAKARARLTTRLKKFVSTEKMQADAKAWSLLGLVPEGTDLMASVLDTLEEQAGGFYDPESKRFFLLDDMPAAMAPMLAAHELTHALEDQHYDLDRRLVTSLDDDDATFAISAVHEGSAMIVMTLHLSASIASGTLKSEDLEAFSRSEAARAETLRALPQALQRQFIGPYLLGMNFLLRGSPAGLADGFPKGDVGRAFQNGPVSSEQVLHPEKFWEPSKRDVPKPVTLGNAAELLGAGWKKRGTGVLGELLLAVFTGAPALDPSDATAGQDASRWTNAAATGWGGDRWELWAKGDWSVVLLVTEWDSERDAAEFAEVLKTRAGLAWRHDGTRVGIVAGNAPDPVELLARLVP